MLLRLVMMLTRIRGIRRGRTRRRLRGRRNRYSSRRCATDGHGIRFLGGDFLRRQLLLLLQQLWLAVVCVMIVAVAGSLAICGRCQTELILGHNVLELIVERVFKCIQNTLQYDVRVVFQLEAVLMRAYLTFKVDYRLLERFLQQINVFEMHVIEERLGYELGH